MAYNVKGPHVSKDRAKWQALCSVVASFEFAKEMCDEIILWPTERPADHLLKRWALEIEDGLASPDPAIEKLMRQKVENYKSLRHWMFLNANIKAGLKLAKEVENGENTGKQALSLSYLGAIVNFGMDKGEHAQKQATSQTLNMGNVRIVSSRAIPTLTNVQRKKAKKLGAGIVVDALAVKVLD